MENFPPTNNQEDLSLPARSQNSQVPAVVFTVNNSNQGHQPLNMVHTITNSLPLSDHRMANSKRGHLPSTGIQNPQIQAFNHGIANFNMRHLRPRISSPALPDQAIPVHLPNMSSTSQNPHIPAALCNQQIPMFNHSIANFSQTNFPQNVTLMSPNQEHMPAVIQNMSPLQQNALNPGSYFENSNSSRVSPNMSAVIPNMSPLQQNAPNPGSYFENSNSNHVSPNMSAVIPNDQQNLPSNSLALPNSQPVINVRNADSNFDNLPSNTPPAFADPKDLVFNIRSSTSNEENRGNTAARGRPRGRPPGSKNKAKVNVSSSESSSIEPLLSLHVPEACDIIPWLLDYAQSREVSLTVLGGFGPISEVILKYVSDSEQPPVGEIMTLMSISGTYVYSPAGVSDDLFFNVKVARENRQVICGSASKIITAGPAMLNVALFKNLHQTI